MKGIPRFLDILLSLLGMVFLFPVFLICMLAIRIDSRGRAIFSQPRIGLRGGEFRIYKFRSMVSTAEEDDLQVTGAEDPRITRTGRWLRRYKLDELPQLFNVFRGDMSLVGPRPRVEKYARQYSPEFREVLFSVRPGITDPATLQAVQQERILGKVGRENRERYYLETILPREVEMNADYIRNRTLWSDFGVLFRTFLALLGVRTGRKPAKVEEGSGPVFRQP